MSRKFIFRSILSFCLIHSISLLGNNANQVQLEKLYNETCEEFSSIYDHLPDLCRLASECSSVIEIGVERMASTWGLLQGLSQSKSPVRSYLGIDLNPSDSSKLRLAKQLAEGNHIVFNFLQANDLTVDIPETEFLFIDSFHSYCHLTYELDKFQTKVSKYIAMHDTSPPFGYEDQEYKGNYSEYPAWINKSKRGLWPAVEDFLQNHPEWMLVNRNLNFYGFTILKRK